MDLKDDSIMMGTFSGPGECNLSMVNAYHEINLPHSVEQQSQGQPHVSMPVSSAASSLSSGLISHHQPHSSQPSNHSQTTATPVISLFKLKNFLYQPKFKNLLHSSEVPNGINNGGSVEEHSQALQSSNGNSQLYSSAVPSRHSMVPNSASTNNSSVGQILGLTQPFKFSSHLQVSNGTTRKYQCKMCPQIFYSKADMQLHTQVHMREAKPYKCSQCSKSFANSSYLSQHTRIHLGIKPYRCEICQRKFTQLSHLQQHIRTHTGDKPYKCRYPNCTKAFSQLSNLQSHSRSHQTDKPFKCNSCYKCFTDEAGLLDHIPKHKESKHLKTHICQFCGKSYTQETYLAKHMQKHSDRLDKRPTLVRQPTQLVDNYWSKNAINACQPSSIDCSNNLVNSQPPPEQQCLQSLSVENHHLPTTRFEQPSRLSMSGLGPINSRNSDELVYGIDKNGNSAFTPLQSSGVLSGANVRMSYFSYESFNFPNKPSSGMEAKKSMEITSKAGHASFPNQLIALNQIRNYASMPPSVSITTAEHPISLKD